MPDAPKATGAAAGDGPVVVDIHWTERWLLPLLTIGVLLDLIISGVLVWLALTTASTADRAASAVSQSNIVAVSQYQSCLASNESRAESLQLWDANQELWTTILTFFTDPRARDFKEAIQTKVDAQNALAQRTFAPRDCVNLSNRTSTTTTRPRGS